MKQKSESESVSHLVLPDSFALPRTEAHQAPLSMEFSRQEYWSGLPFVYVYIGMYIHFLCMYHVNMYMFYMYMYRLYMCIIYGFVYIQIFIPVCHFLLYFCLINSLS